MKDLLKLSAVRMTRKFQVDEVTSVELTRARLDRIHAANEQVRALPSVDDGDALAAARDVDARRATGESLHRSAKVPIAVEDNMITRGKPAICASKILEDWLPPYDATVVERLHEVGLPIVGKANMDEFTMGSSAERFAYGEMHNPWDLDHIPRGSSEGSTAAVSALMVPWALGSDIGDSIRQPVAVTRIVGAKSAYRGVSRYGPVAMVSSLDQIGPFARNVADAAASQEIVGGHDPRDSALLDAPVPSFEEIAAETASSVKSSEGVRVDMVKQLSDEGCQEDIAASFQEALETIKDPGAQAVKVSCPSLKCALGAYYLIVSTEIPSNLARLDGMRYGIHVEPEEGLATAETVMAVTRGAGFGPEAKRRIVLGTHVSPSDYYDAYYGSARRVHTLIQRDFDATFGEANMFASPTSPVTAWKLGPKLEDPLAMYVLDITMIPANLAGIPGISIPSGLAGGLPVGLQILAPARADAQIYRVAGVVEARLGKPLAESYPAAGWGEK